MASSNYVQRFWDMWYLCGPGSWQFLATTQHQLEEARQLLVKSKEGQHVDAARLTHAQRLAASVLHPDTGEPILLPFRMAAHVPVNAMLLCAMLGSRTVLGTALAQWANQSFNALQFYANRNASNPVPTNTVLMAYTGAVISSVSVAAGLRSLFTRLESRPAAPRTPAPLAMIRVGSAAVPFLGAAAAKPLQIGLMRQDELRQGVTVATEDGVVVGTSVLAGRTAVGLTIATRTLYLAPMLWMPYVQAWMERSIPLLGRNRAAATLSLVLHSAVNSAVVTPACIALFDQRASLPVAALEAHIRDAVHAGGERVYFNKGL